MSRSMKFIVACLWGTMIAVAGCGDSNKVKPPSKEMPTIPGGPQAAGDGGKAGGKQQQNAPPGTGTAN